MKHISILLVLPLLTLANPFPNPEPKAEPELVDIEKRSVTCGLTGSNVKYRQKPATTSIADGQFGATGTKVAISCFTTGASVSGDPYWLKIASGSPHGKAGDWFTAYYVSTACWNNLINVISWC